MKMQKFLQCESFKVQSAFMGFWGKLFGKEPQGLGKGGHPERNIAEATIKCPFCGGGKIDSDADYNFPVWICSCGSIGAGARLPGLHEMGQQLLGILEIHEVRDDVCLPADSAQGSGRQLEFTQVRQKMAKILDGHGYDFQVGPGQEPDITVFWAKQRSEAGLAVTKFELIPKELTVEVHSHSVTGGLGSLEIPCWTYVTHGLMRYQQPEIIFTLVRPAKEVPIPKEPLDFFCLIDKLAQSGRVARAGDITQFGTKKFLGRHVAYVTTWELPGIPLPSSAIHAILLTDDEIVAAQDFGLTRILALLANVYRFYPYPYWSDPERPGVSFVETREASLLCKILSLRLRGARVYQENNKVVLQLPEEMREEYEQQLAEIPENTGFALLTDWDPAAQACFVWEPGQSGRKAVAGEGVRAERICGCFLMLAGPVQEDEVFDIEDGFAAAFSPPSWDTFRQALMEGGKIEIPSTSGKRIFVLD